MRRGLLHNLFILTALFVWQKAVQFQLLRLQQRLQQHRRSALRLQLQSPVYRQISQVCYSNSRSCVQLGWLDSIVGLGPNGDHDSDLHECVGTTGRVWKVGVTGSAIGSDAGLISQTPCFDFMCIEHG